MGSAADTLFEFLARAHGIPSESMHAVTMGPDLVFVRDAWAANPRVLREEWIHARQQRLGLATSANRLDIEIAAREEILANAVRRGVTTKEVDELRKEIHDMQTRGRY